LLDWNRCWKCEWTMEFRQPIVAHCVLAAFVPFHSVRLILIADKATSYVQNTSIECAHDLCLLRLARMHECSLELGIIEKCFLKFHSPFYHCSPYSSPTIRDTCMNMYSVHQFGVPGRQSPDPRVVSP